MLYYFLVDMKGSLYEVGVEGNNRNDIEKYFKQYSHDVRFTRESEEIINRKTARKTPVGRIMSCNFKGDKIKCLKT